jgi:hypothetical protein
MLDPAEAPRKPSEGLSGASGGQTSRAPATPRRPKSTGGLVLGQRDRRRRSWFSADNEILDDYGPQCWVPSTAGERLRDRCYNIGLIFLTRE